MKCVDEGSACSLAAGSNGKGNDANQFDGPISVIF